MSCWREERNSVQSSFPLFSTNKESRSSTWMCLRWQEEGRCLWNGLQRWWRWCRSAGACKKILCGNGPQLFNFFFLHEERYPHYYSVTGVQKSRRTIVNKKFLKRIFFLPHKWSIQIQWMTTYREQRCIGYMAPHIIVKMYCENQLFGRKKFNLR